MQQKGNKMNRQIYNICHLRKKTQLSKQYKHESTSRNFHSLNQHSDSYSQIQKQQFAQQYTKLTKQFQKLLSKNVKNNGKGTEKYRMMSGKMEKVRLLSQQKLLGSQKKQKNISDIQYSSANIKLQSFSQRKLNKRNAKLDNLYSNRLHNQILQTAKLNKNKIQKSLSNIPLFQTNKLLISINNSSQSNQPLPIFPDKQIFLHLQPQKSHKINSAFNYISETLAHFHNLYKIHELLQNYKNSYQLLIKNIKKYIMNYNKADIGKLVDLLKISNDRQNLKVFLCLQKIAVLGILDAMIQQNQYAVKTQGKNILQATFGVYRSIFTFILQQKTRVPDYPKKQAPSQFTTSQSLQSLQICLQLLNSLQIHNRKDLQSTIQFLYKKIQNLYRSNQKLFHKIKTILITITKININNSGMVIIKYDNIININRFFYFLLCQYAYWLNNVQNITVLKVHRNMLDFFVTCPAPHLAYSVPQGKMTIVMQLQGILALFKFSNIQDKISIKLRPYALQLVRQLSKNAQLIMMTTLLPQNIPYQLNNNANPLKPKHLTILKQQQYYKQLLSYASSVLYKHHYVRYRSLLIKDIKRLGRKLQKTILIDDISYNTNPSTQQSQNNQNTKLNEQNTIQISTWKGNVKDQQLIYLKQLLLDIIDKRYNDVRVILNRIKFTNKYKKIYQQKQQFIQAHNNKYKGQQEQNKQVESNVNVQIDEEQAKYQMEDIKQVNQKIK